MLKAYFILTFYYVIYCTVQHHRILLYNYGAIEINKHLHLHYFMKESLNLLIQSTGLYMLHFLIRSLKLTRHPCLDDQLVYLLMTTSYIFCDDLDDFENTH